MNQLTLRQNEEDYADEPTQALAEVPSWELQQLKPKHLQICALLAQGFKNIEVAGMVGVTKEYVSMLLRQPLIKQEIMRKGEVVGARLELMTELSTDAIAHTLQNGNASDKMKAARLQLEVTKRIGRPDPMANQVHPDVDRLARLAERLIQLQSGIRQGRTFNEDGSEVS
jgi:hypothetical protein